MASPDSHFSRFFIIWLGQLLSKIGGGISAFALGIYLFEQLGSATAYSFLLLCAFLPAVLLAPLGGVIADRYDRKRLMLISDLGSAFCVLVIIILLVINPAAYWAIYLGISACSIFVAFHSPAYKASVSDLLDEESYAKASGLIQLAEASRYLVAPAIAGVLMAKVSLSWVLMIDLITFLAGALTVGFIRKVSIRVTEQARIKDFSSSSVKSEISAGIQFILSNQIIRHLLMLTSIVTFLTGVLQVLFVPLVLSFADSTTLGTVQSVSASGMLLSSLFIGMFSQTKQLYRTLAWSLAIAGVFYLLIGIMANAIALTVVAFGFFLALPFVNTNLEVLFRQNIRNDMQGRVWSLVSLISQFGMLIALATTGFLVDYVFDPLLSNSTSLLHHLAQHFGIGGILGSRFMVVLSGILLFLYALLILINSQQFRARTSTPTT